MSKQLAQARYGQGIIDPNVTTIEGFNSIFNDKSITQLNIQALPGTLFFINDNSNQIIIGNTGIYEINLEGFNSKINSLTFLSVPEGGYIIVDYIFEDQGGNS